MNWSRHKLKEWHSKFLELFAESNFGKEFTLVDARKAFLRESSDLNGISHSSLSQLFRLQLKFSYKKLGINNLIEERPENKSNLLSWIKLIFYLVKERFHVVFLDEFIINIETTKAYCWARKGQPGRLLEKPSDFKMSFIVSHSPARVEGLVGTTTTFNQDKYADFLRTLIVKLKSDSEIEDKMIVLMTDNCRFHRTTKSRKYLKKKDLYDSSFLHTPQRLTRVRS